MDEFQDAGRWVVQFQAENHELKQQLQKKDEALREAEKAIKDVFSYAKHSEGCNAPFGVRYGCKCGFFRCGKDTDEALSKIRAALK